MQKDIISFSKIIFSLSLLSVLVGCAHSEKAPFYGIQSDAVSQSACQDNAYLERFGCSLQRVEQAAQTNEPDAEYALGYMYYNGIGTVKDTDTATVWIERAAQQGQPLAISALKTMRQSQFPAMGQVNQNDQTSSSPQKPASTTASQQSPASSDHGSPKAFGKHDDLNFSLLEAGLKTGGHHQQAHHNTAQPAAQAQASVPNNAPRATSYRPTALKKNNSLGNLRDKPANHFTVQLFASPSLNNVRHLQQSLLQNVPMTIASMQKSGTTWYVLLAGDFSNRQQAESFVSTLPPAISASKPWIRSFGSLEQ